MSDIPATNSPSVSIDFPNDSYVSLSEYRRVVGLLAEEHAARQALCAKQDDLQEEHHQNLAIAATLRADLAILGSRAKLASTLARLRFGAQNAMLKALHVQLDQLQSGHKDAVASLLSELSDMQRCYDSLLAALGGSSISLGMVRDQIHQAVGPLERFAEWAQRLRVALEQDAAADAAAPSGIYA
uniref:Uncharacterized protein n=1 Tax=Mycena chlorophos TaxID=658473 RepID=A0ABQ0KUQ0_MYCCL|nr:predicted protein [Mycena chlorophos]